MRTKEISLLGDAIRATHGCESEYLGLKNVRAQFTHEVAWDGCVFVFQLSGHPKAERCYAWNHSDGNMITTVLEIAPVDCAEAAVHVAIADSASKMQRSIRLSDAMQ
jgi:hypothetical protein